MLRPAPRARTAAQLLRVPRRRHQRWVGRLVARLVTHRGARTTPDRVVGAIRSAAACSGARGSVMHRCRALAGVVRTSSLGAVGARSNRDRIIHEGLLPPEAYWTSVRPVVLRCESTWQGLPGQLLLSEEHLLSERASRVGRDCATGDRPSSQHPSADATPGAAPASTAFARAYSSIGQSPRLITGLFLVRTQVGPLAPYPRRGGLPSMTVPSRARSVLAVARRRRTCAARRCRGGSSARERRSLGPWRSFTGPSFTGRFGMEPSGRALAARSGIAMRRPTYL